MSFFIDVCGNWSRYAKGETREEILHRRRGGGYMTAAELTSETARKKNSALADLMAVKLRLGRSAEQTATGITPEGEENDENDGAGAGVGAGAGAETPPAGLKTPGSRWRQLARDGDAANKALAAARRQNVETVVSTLIKMKLDKKKTKKGSVIG